MGTLGWGRLRRGQSRRGGRLSDACLLAALLLPAVAAALPGAGTTAAGAWVVAAGAGAGAALTVAGIRRHRPARPVPWVLLAACQAGCAAQAVLWAVRPDVPVAPTWLSEVNRVSLALALVGLAVARRPPWSAAGLVDTAAVTVGAALVLVVLGARGLDGALYGALGGFLGGWDVALDLVMVAALAYPTFADPRPPHAAFRLALGFGVITLAGALLAPWADALPDAPRAVAAVQALLPTGMLLMSAAALHPSMAVLARPMHRGPVSWSTGRTLVLAASFGLPALVGLSDPSPAHGMLRAVTATLTAMVLVLVVRTRMAVDGLADARRREHLQANHDHVTGIGTRAYLADTLLEACEPPRNHVGLLHVDLDDFSAVNDTASRRVGDELLAAVALRLRALSHEEPDVTVARLGADSFAVAVLAGRDDVRARTAALVDRIRADSEEPFDLSDGLMSVGVSVGVTTGSVHGPEDVSRLLVEAEIALQSGKGHRGTLSWFTPALRARLERRSAILQALRGKDLPSQLELVLHPLMHIGDDTLLGFEALVRWSCPELGPVPPDEFVPIAETTGHVVDVDLAVALQALAWLGRRSRPAGPPLVVSLNASVTSLSSQWYADGLLAAVRLYGVEPGQVWLEVTERMLVDDHPAALDAVRRLAMAGIRVVIDDFGTEYSSLAYLARLPSSVVKLDRAFVVGLDAGDDDRHAQLVAGAVEFAHRLGHEVVAEGVETLDQLEALVRMGCDIGQGYLWSRPLGPEEAADWQVRRDSRQAAVEQTLAGVDPAA